METCGMSLPGNPHKMPINSAHKMGYLYRFKKDEVEVNTQSIKSERKKE
jgi:hypothetical protein